MPLHEEAMTLSERGLEEDGRPGYKLVDVGEPHVADETWDRGERSVNGADGRAVVGLYARPKGG